MVSSTSAYSSYSYTVGVTVVSVVTILLNLVIYFYLSNLESKLLLKNLRLKNREAKSRKELEDHESESESESHEIIQSRAAGIGTGTSTDNSTDMPLIESHGGTPVSNKINIRTRGELESFRQIGTLTATSVSGDSRILPLFGRRLYSASDKWNYYTTTDGYNMVSLPIVNKKKDCSGEYGCDEISSEDVIFIPEYNQEYVARVYNSSEYRYIPVV